MYFMYEPAQWWLREFALQASMRWHGKWGGMRRRSASEREGFGVFVGALTIAAAFWLASRVAPTPLMLVALTAFFCVWTGMLAMLVTAILSLLPPFRWALDSKARATALAICIAATALIDGAGVLIDEHFKPARDYHQACLEETERVSRQTWFGSVCRDGWLSPSTGRGTCSWHRGIDREATRQREMQTRETLVVHRAPAQCWKRALRASWIE